MNDKNDPDGIKREKHAIKYYESIRNRSKNREIETISSNTGISKNRITKAYEHVFENMHLLDGKIKHFDPDYDMAQSWQRLREGKNIQSHDITLLKHELLEQGLMNRYNHSYDKAHEITERKYNYRLELEQWKRND